MAADDPKPSILRILLGERPRMVLLFVTPTALAIAIDVALRPRSLLAFEPLQWLNYFGSSLASAGFWGGPLWLASRMFGRGTALARAGLGLFAAAFVFPFAAFSFVGQPLFFLVFHSYMARDTVRLGIALRGTLGAWMASWGASFVLMGVLGIVVTAGILALARRAAGPARAAWPIVPIVGFGIAAYCFWIDFVESRSLQAAPPDTCFIHGVVHALRDGVTGKGWVRRGVSLREPAPLPHLTPAAHRPNVIVILSESMRADAMCSAPGSGCTAPFLDEVAPDRLPLGRLTSQSSGTFTSCAVLWTGLAPDADFTTMHRAPVLWEIAHAVGYETAYIASQNLRYEDLATFLKRAGIDVEVSAAELGGAGDPHVGAPDEAATARLLEFVRSVPTGTPYFALLHLSNTHWPYRVDPALQPNTPHDASPFGDLGALHNHYRNSVLFQERTVSALLRELRALPGWDDTAVLFLADHGEEFREHGRLYHLTSLFDEQVRVPGWLVAGPHAVDPAQAAALRLYAGRRTYTQDVHVTVLDLLGVFDQARDFPFADRIVGRSLLRRPAPVEPTMVLSTASGVWEPDEPKYGIMRGDFLVVRSDASPWQCYDAANDPREYSPVSAPLCQTLEKVGDGVFSAALKR